MRNFKKTLCRCSCGRTHYANIAGADMDNVNMNNIPCPDCVEGMQKQERKRNGQPKNME